MKTILKAGTVDIPDGVTVSLKSRIVTVKGPRGEIVKDFKHLPIDLTMKDEKTVKVERWFTTGKQASCIRTACSHIGNMIIGVTKVRAPSPSPSLPDSNNGHSRHRRSRGLRRPAAATRCWGGQLLLLAAAAGLVQAGPASAARLPPLRTAPTAGRGTERLAAERTDRCEDSGRVLVLVGTRLPLLWVLWLHPRLFVRLRQGFEYKMRFVYAHFPINVAITGAKNKIEIRNFLGEKIVRTVDAYPGVTATRSADIKDEIVVVGNDIDNVSKTWYATARTACCDGHASGRTGPQGGPTSSPAARGARPLAAPHRMRHRIPSPFLAAPRSPSRGASLTRSVSRCSVAVLWSSRFAR